MTQIKQTNLHYSEYDATDDFDGHARDLISDALRISFQFLFFKALILSFSLYSNIQELA